MNYAVLFILVTGGVSLAITLVVILREKQKQTKSRDIVMSSFWRIAYSPMDAIICNKRTPYNENTDGDIDEVRQFYPAARLRKK